MMDHLARLLHFGILKFLFITFAALLSSSSVRAQGRVTFQNFTTSMITTNDGQGNSGPMSGLNAYRIGLYVGGLDASEDSLTLVSVAGNGPLLGRFSGGNPLRLPAPWGGMNQTLTFQVRAWSYGGGASYEEAMASGGAWLGKSSLGTVIPTFAPYPAAILFVLASDLGIIDGFEIRPPSISSVQSVPEPSAYALGGLALLCVALFQRKRSVGVKHSNR